MPYSDVMGCFINYVAPAFTGATLHLFTRGLNARPPLILATFVARLWLFEPKFIRIRTCALGGNRLAYMSEQNVCCHFFAGADKAGFGGFPEVFVPSGTGTSENPFRPLRTVPERLEYRQIRTGTEEKRATPAPVNKLLITLGCFLSKWG